MTIYNRQPSPTQSQSATINMTEDTPLVTDGNRHHNLLPASSTCFAVPSESSDNVNIQLHLFS
jgi:hypothetical protein